MRFGGDLGAYIRRPGDQMVVVPDGRYTVGDVTAPHPETHGPLRGWLVLVAQTRQQVVVDLADTSFVLHAGTSRVMFVGMRFINGTVSVRGADDIVFWYTDHSFDPHVWRRQFDAAGGNEAALASILATRARRQSGSASAARSPERISFFASDFHDVGDDAIFVTGQAGGTVTGVRVGT